MVALVWRSYCRCAEITDRLLQMLTTFDQHGQCPCKEGRKNSEKKPTKDIWAWGEHGERYSPRSIITRQRWFHFQSRSIHVGGLCHSSDKIPTPSNTEYPPVTTPAGAKHP